MAVPLLTDVLDESELFNLGQDFVTELAAIDSSRSELVNERYVTFIDNYEGNVAPAESEKPWDGSSDAHIAKTATDTDIMYARFMSAVFGQSPRFMIDALSGQYQGFAFDTQKLSEYLETQEIPLYDVLSQAFLILCKFGTVVIYAPWVNQPITHHELDDNGNFVAIAADLFDKPNLQVIHPKDFYMPRGHRDVQLAPWVGYKYKLRLPELRLWRDTGFFYDDAAERLEAEFGDASERGEPQIRTPIASNLVDRVQEERERSAGLSRAKATDELDMVHVFARRDIDGDGREEEINLHLHRQTGVVARLTYSHYRHRRRPFVDLHYFPRDGVWESIGLPEMLENFQRNVDVTFRQIQDNNTVKNTQSFRATEGGAVQPNEGFHPAKIWFVKKGDDFEPLRMGDGVFNTSMNDLQFLLGEASKRDGVSDASAGVGQDRQTATAVLALLQENSRRSDLIMGGVRDKLAELWMQVLELYAQFKPLMEFPDAEGAMLEWHYMPGETFRRRVAVRPTMTTAALNKAILRQELQMLEQSLQAYAQSQLPLINAFLTAQDPTLKEYLAETLGGMHLVMERTIQTYEFAKDVKEILPNPVTELQNVNPLQPPLGGTEPGGGGGSASPVGTPQGLLPNPGAGTAPATAPGRPGPEVGLPKPGGGTGGAT